jgi:hypothetical protein
MGSENVQVSFFLHIKALLPPHLSLVDEIAELLNISNDSAYRRIRGEKPIPFDELQKLCGHFRISLDQFFHLQSDSLVFTARTAGDGTSDYELYLQDILRNLHLMNSFPEREMYYLNKDIPIFHFFLFPEMMAFKSFFWMKTILHLPQYANQTFRLDGFGHDKILQLGRQLSEAYHILPSQEIWNTENINSTIRQVEYYKNSGVFASRQDIIAIYDCLQKTIDHLECQAEVGHKLAAGNSGNGKGATYKMYVNELILGDNTILTVLGDRKITYINHSVLNYLVTSDPGFCEYTYQNIRNLIKRSTLISEVGEKERKRFFNMIREKITSRRNAL